MMSLVRLFALPIVSGCLQFLSVFLIVWFLLARTYYSNGALITVRRRILEPPGGDLPIAANYQGYRPPTIRVARRTNKDPLKRASHMRIPHNQPFNHF